MNRHERRASIKRSGVAALIAFDRGGFAYAADGKRLVIVRPKTPDVAMLVARVALETQNSSLLENLPDNEDNYVFAGYLSADGKSVLDEKGVKIGAPQRGDSLVTLKEPPN